MITLIRNYAGAPYLRIDALPTEDQEPFSKWLFRQTRPVIPSELDANGEPATCAYPWDYERWLAENKPAALADPYAT